MQGTETLRFGGRTSVPPLASAPLFRPSRQLSVNDYIQHVAST